MQQQQAHRDRHASETVKMSKKKNVKCMFIVVMHLATQS